MLAGDAAGVVAPASGEGIYYAMLGGQLAGEAVMEFLESKNPASLQLARKRFMKEHRLTFIVLGIMQYFWYTTNKRRESFVKMCEDKDVQKLTFESYMHKKLVRKKPLAHVKIFFKDMGTCWGLPRHKQSTTDFLLQKHVLAAAIWVWSWRLPAVLLLK